MIPTVEQCFEFMNKHEMLQNIKEHSVVVEKIASAIAHGLLRSGFSGISLGKTTAGALMHDIGKGRGFITGEDHADIGREICLKNDLEEIADIVGEHVRLKTFKPNGEISEKEIVYYADKRVKHDLIVDLDERLDYLLIRYGNNDETRCRLISENMDLCKEVERKLFADLYFEPDELGSIINDDQIDEP